MLSPLLGTTVAFLAFSLPTAAFTQDSNRASTRREVTQAQAVQIARGYGIVEVEEVERDDGGWEIEGRDRRGRNVEVTVNRDGRVTNVDRSEAPARDDDD